jgi:hypothetical protein
VVERRLHAYAADAALRLHTARSRNDQSATDTRLWMLASLPTLDATLKQLIEVKNVWYPLGHPLAGGEKVARAGTHTARR